MPRLRPYRLPARGLYAITDGPRPDLYSAVESALNGGAAILQYRDKSAESERRHAEAASLLAACRRFGIPLIVNDDVDLAAAIGADGVHLGEHDGTVAAARGILGERAIVGVSCYDDLHRAEAAAAAGADYIAFGAFFPSITKPNARRATLDLLRAAATLDIPRVAIGGITPDNARPLVDAGADLIAIVGGVFDAPDPVAAARACRSLFAFPEP